MLRTLSILLALAQPVAASEDIADQYPQSPLYSKPVEFIPGVFSAIGATAPPTYENSGHNNNLSFIVTGEGVVVVNGGGAYVLAEALHAEIKDITDEPVVLVINENGQGHAMLGNSYWAEQGVPILAHVDAAAEFEERGFRILENMQRVNRDKAEGTYLPVTQRRRRCCLAAEPKPCDCRGYGIPRTYAADFRGYIYLGLVGNLGQRV